MAAFDSSKFKAPRKFRFLRKCGRLIMVPVICLASVPAFAQVDGTWTGGTDDDWSETMNWSTDPLLPSVAGDTARFLGAGAGDINLSAPITVGHLEFNGGVIYNVNGGGNQLTLDNSGFAGNATIDFTTGTTTIGADIALADDVDIDAAVAAAITGVISGTGNVTKNGAGTLTLSGANSYVGTTDINAGVLRLGAAGVITDTSRVDVGAAGELNLNGFSETIASLVGSGAVELTDQVLTLGGDNTSPAAFTGTIDGTGAIVKEGTGTFSVSGPNMYMGGTTINGGTVAIDNGSSLGAGNITFNGGGLSLSGGLDVGNVVDFAGAGTIDTGAGDILSGDFMGAGDMMKTGAGTLTLEGDLTGYTGNVMIDAGVLSVDTTAASTTLAGNISGPGGLSTTGGNILTLGGTNTFGGGLTIDGGTVSAGSEANLGDPASTITFNNGGILRTTAAINSTHAIVMTGDGTFNTNGVDSTFSGDVTGAGNLTKSGGGNATFSGSLTGYTGATSIAAGDIIVDTSGGDTSLSGNITGAGGLVKIGDNILTLSTLGANTFSGGLDINGGIVSVNDGDQLGTEAISFDNGTLRTTLGITSFNTPLTFNAGGGTIDTDGNDSLFGGNLAGVGDVSLTDGGVVTFFGTLGGHTGNWNLNDFSTADFFVGGIDTINGDISGNGGIRKTGGGNLQLAGSGTYAGATDIQAGTITLLRSDAIGDMSAVTVAAGARLDLNTFSETIGSLEGGGVVTLNGATLTTGGNDISPKVFSGVIEGSAGSQLIKTGNGDFTLSGINTFQGSTTINEGDLFLDGGMALADDNVVDVQTDGDLILLDSETIGSLMGTGNVELNANTLTTGEMGDTEFFGIISGTGGLVKQGAGTFTLSDSNDYMGATTITAGTLRLGANNALSNVTAVTVANGATFDLNNFNETIGTLADDPINGGGSVTLGTGTLTTDGLGTVTPFSGVISGDGGLTKIGGGTLTLNGVNTYIGPTMINAGTLQLGMAGQLSDTTAVTVAGGTFDLNDVSDTIGSLAGGGNVTLGTGTLTTGGDDSSTTYSGSISGTGGLTKEGMGTFLLDGANMYTGATTINAGTLQLGANAAGMAIADLSRVNVAMGAIFDLNNFSETIGSLSDFPANGGVGGSVMLGTGTLTTGADGSPSTFSGVISGDGGLVKVGAGTFTLRGINTYTGGTSINGGTVSISDDNNLGAATGPLSFANNGILAITADLTTGRDVTLNAGDGTIDTNPTPVVGGPFNAIFNGTISGVGGLTKINDGTLTLTGTNTYAGGTNINGGTVSVGSDLNLGDAGGDVTFMNGGILQTSAGITSGRALTFNLPGGGTVDTQTFDSSFTGAVTGAGNMTKDGTGTLVLSGGLAGYTGDTTLTAGTLDVNTNAGSTTHAGAISGPGNLRKSGSNTLTLAGSLDMFTGNTAIDAGVLDVNTAGGSTTYAGVISGIGSLSKTGVNTLTLNGMNTYTGPTAINAGTLQLGAADVLSDMTAVTVAAGAIFDVNGFDDTIGSLAGTGNVMLGTGNLTAGADNTNTTFGGVISGTGQFIKTGTGTMVLSGANTHTGGTAMNGGILSVGNDVNLGGPGGGLSFDGGTLFTTAGINTPRLVTLNAGGGTIDTNGFNSTLSGVISGVGGLAKQGAGTLTLTGLNTYQGGTAINGGTLSVGSDANLGAPAGPLSFNGGTLLTTGAVTSARAVAINAGGGTVDTNGFNSSFSGPLTGTGDLSKIGAGTLRLSGGLSGYTGDTAITAGTLEVNTDGGDTAHVGALSGPGDLVKSGSNTLTMAGNLNGFTGDVAINGGILDVDTTAGSTALVGDVSGVGGLSKSGPNTLTLSGMNTYSGPTAINAGMLTLGSGTGIGDQSAVTVAAGATLNQNGFSETIGSLAGAGDVTLGAGTLTTGGNNDTTTFSGVMSGNGGLVKEGTGIFTLSGIISYLGGTTINAGTVSIGDNLNLGDAAGPLSFGGGTLLTTADVTSNRAVTLNAGGGTIDTSTFNSTFSGVFFGPGALTKEGTGTLTLTGANTYLGGTNINDGTLSVSNNNNLGGIAGPLNFDGGTLLTTAGIISARNGTINAGGATIDTNGFSSTLAGMFGGAGGLTKNGLGTLSLDGMNTYVGPTTINGGRLDVNGSITSDTTANTGTTLGGNGTITGDVVIADGATMAPGNSIGQTNIVGNYTQLAGSIFELEVRPAPRGAEVAGVDFDQTNVTGAAVINPGATVNVVSAPGTYQLGNRFRFLQTTGGVTGTYDPLANVTFNGGLLVGNLVYGANTADLVINRTNFSGVGSIRSKNERAAAGALDQLSMIAATAPGSDAANVINQLLVLPGPQLANAANQIGGASHASNQVVALQSSFDYLQAVRNRVRTGLVNIDNGRRDPIWVEGLGTFGTIDPDGNAAGVEYDSRGFIFGFDQGMAGGRQGITVGVHQMDTESGRDTGTIDSYNITAYTSTIADPVYIMGALGYGRNDFESTRQLSVLNPDRVANGSTSGNQLMGLLEYGLFANTDNWETQFFVSGQYAGLQQDGFVETGANSMNLNVSDSSTNSFRTTIGMRMAGKLSGRVEPEFHAGFIHEFLDADSMTSASFNGTNASFKQCGVALSENMGQVGFGSTLILANNSSIYVGYDALISGSQLSQAVNGTFVLDY